LIVPDRQAGDASPLFVIDTQTGARQPLTSPAAAEIDVEPSIASDGSLLLFNRVRGEFQSDVFVQRLRAEFTPDGPPRRLPSTSSWNGTPRLLAPRGEVLTSADLLTTDPAAFARLLETARPTSLSTETRALIMRSLPEQGEATRLDAPALRKLGAVQEVLRAAGRDTSYEVKSST
jgi:hypothetical protein